ERVGETDGFERVRRQGRHSLPVGIAIDASCGRALATLSVWAQQPGLDGCGGKAATASRSASQATPHPAASASTKPKNTTLMMPFIVKKAALSRRRSPGRTRACSYASSAA